MHRMTLSQARLIKKFRCNHNYPSYSWRLVAEICSIIWNGDWSDNQLAGKELCDIAARKLKEDPNKEPWN